MSKGNIQYLFWRGNFLQLRSVPCNSFNIALRNYNTLRFSRPLLCGPSRYPLAQCCHLWIARTEFLHEPHIRSWPSQASPVLWGNWSSCVIRQENACSKQRSVPASLSVNDDKVSVQVLTRNRSKLIAVERKHLSLPLLLPTVRATDDTYTNPLAGLDWVDVEFFHNSYWHEIWCSEAEIRPQSRCHLKIVVKICCAYSMKLYEFSPSLSREKRPGELLFFVPNSHWVMSTPSQTKWNSLTFLMTTYLKSYPPHILRI